MTNKNRDPEKLTQKEMDLHTLEIKLRDQERAIVKLKTQIVAEKAAKQATKTVTETPTVVQENPATSETPTDEAPQPAVTVTPTPTLRSRFTPRQWEGVQWVYACLWAILGLATAWITRGWLPDLADVSGTPDWLFRASWVVLVPLAGFFGCGLLVARDDQRDTERADSMTRHGSNPNKHIKQPAEPAPTL